MDVSDIADLALAAAAPVQFKATCAAFINSDIRIALQEGHSRENIVAGLVYAIADNYLNQRQRRRARRQEGVPARRASRSNRAVGHAFAHSVGRPGGHSAAARNCSARWASACWPAKSAGESLKPGTDLLDLAAPEMKRIGRFTCGACTMYCSIDRFEVAGRRFPFGGRCSLYENVWKRKARIAAAPDLVRTAKRPALRPGPTAS